MAHDSSDTPEARPGQKPTMAGMGSSGNKGAYDGFGNAPIQKSEDYLFFFLFKYRIVQKATLNFRRPFRHVQELHQVHQGADGVRRQPQEAHGLVSEIGHRGVSKNQMQHDHYKSFRNTVTSKGLLAKEKKTIEQFTSKENFNKILCLFSYQPIEKLPDSDNLFGADADDSETDKFNEMVKRMEEKKKKNEEETGKEQELT